MSDQHDDPSTTPPYAAPGDRLGPYKLLQRLGEGGMGTVWQAEQTEPVRRTVAVKLIKSDLDSGQYPARFEAERQALALMDHPNIAKVFDAGTTPDGRPYFVMELVKGLPFTRYCDEARLTLRERLGLFILVCQAVQHAHQKGIIHRDLKPSNILVALYDGKPVPKVIDFGVAKALHQPLTEKTLVTELGVLVGSPEYAAPEQAEVDALDIDTRADIYSLGVILYELLTGAKPFDRRQWQSGGLHELLRLIREVEPPTPSTRLTGVDTLAETAARRQTDPKQLAKLVRGELDWIVMKCLEKERSRRYDTANDLALEIGRFLRDEPVLAGPPSKGYRLKKFVWRNKGPVLTAAAMAVLLVGGMVGTSWGMVNAELARKQALVSLGQLKKGNEILGSVFKDVDPRADEKGGDSLRVQLGERLAQAAAQLEGEAVGDALVVARLQSILGTTLRELGHYDRALPLLEEAQQTMAASLGADNADTLASKNELALLYLRWGHYVRAEPLLQEVLKARSAKLGADDLDTLDSKNNLAMLYYEWAQYPKAELLFQEVLQARTAKLGADRRETLVSKNNLAALYVAQSQFAQAEPLFQQVLQARTRQLGADDIATLATKNDLAVLSKKRGKYREAERLFHEVQLGSTAKLGAYHPYTLLIKNNFAEMYSAQRDYTKAEPLLQDVAHVQTIRLGADHPHTLTSKNNLAMVYEALRQYPKAESLCQEVLHSRIVTLGLNNRKTLESKRNLATLYSAQKQYDKAEPLYQEVLQACMDSFGADDIDTLESMSNLATLYYKKGDYAKADPLLQEALPKYIRKVGPDNPRTQVIKNNLAALYSARRYYAKAEPLYRELADYWKRNAGPDSLQYAGRLASLGVNLLNQNKAAEAETVLSECLAIRENKEPDIWTTFNTKSLLGGTYLVQKKYADAEPLLVQGYEGMKKHEAKIPEEFKAPRLSEGLERLVKLFDEWGKPDEAAKWRKELESLPKPEAKPTAPPTEKANGKKP